MVSGSKLFSIILLLLVSSNECFGFGFFDSLYKLKKPKDGRWEILKEHYTAEQWKLSPYMTMQNKTDPTQAFVKFAQTRFIKLDERKQVLNIIELNVHIYVVLL